MGETGAEVLADRFDVSPHIETLDVGRLIQLFVHPGDSSHAKGRVFQLLGERGVAIFAGLEAKHARDKREAVLHPVIHLADEKLMPLKRGFQIALVPLALNRHPENVCRPLQKREVVFDELVARPAVHLQHAERPARRPAK